MTVKRVGLRCTCDICGREWWSRKETPPVQAPCGHRDWHRPAKSKSSKRKKKSGN